MLHPTYRITHTTTFVTPVVEHWLERVEREPIIILDLDVCSQHVWYSGVPTITK